MALSHDTVNNTWTGLSTDVKPTALASRGEQFTETDTGKVFEFIGVGGNNGWVHAPQSVSWSDSTGTALVKPDGTNKSLSATQLQPAGLTIVLAGDSITAGSNNLFTPTLASFSGSGTTGTITNGSSTYPLVGTKIWISSFAQSEWNGEKTILTSDGSTITFTNATTLTASPTSAYGYTTGFFSDETFTGNRAFTTIANGLLGLPFGSIVNRAVSGTTSAQCLSNFSTDVLSLNPNYVFLLVGVNDVKGNAVITEAQIFANIQSMVAAATSRGITVLLSTLTPLTASDSTSAPATTGAPSSRSGTAQQQMILRLNQLIRRYANVTPGVILIDVHASTGLTTSNAWLSTAYTVDGIHPTSYAAFKGFALPMKTALANAGLTRTWPLVDNAGDCYASDNSSLQLLPNPLFTTTTTSAITGFTGASGVGNPTYATDTAPSRYAGTPTASIDMATRADGYGQNQRCTITATANNDIIAFVMANTGNLNPQIALYPGRTAKFAMGFKITNVPAGTFNGIDMLLITPSGAILWDTITQASTGNFIDITSGNYEWIIESAPFTIPNPTPAMGNSPNFIRPEIRLHFAGNAAAAVFEFGRWQLQVLN